MKMPVFEDYFDTEASLANYLTVGAVVWSWLDGMLHSEGLATESKVEITPAAGPALVLADFSFSSKIVPRQFGEFGPGILFRWDRAANSYYLFRIEQTFIKLAAIVGGVWTDLVIAVSPIPIVPDTEYTVYIVANGSSIQVYLNGVLVADVVDERLQSGSFGLNVNDANADFDDITIDVVGAYVDVTLSSNPLVDFIQPPEVTIPVQPYIISVPINSVIAIQVPEISGEYYFNRWVDGAGMPHPSVTNPYLAKTTLTATSSTTVIAFYTTAPPPPPPPAIPIGIALAAGACALGTIALVIANALK